MYLLPSKILLYFAQEELSMRQIYKLLKHKTNFS